MRTPDYVSFALLFGLEVAAVVASIVLSARRLHGSGALVLCSRCERLHERTNAVGRIADAIAVGALAFLAALPFVAAGYESGVTFPQVLLAVSAVIAVVAAAAEADVLARAAAARMWPHLTWSAEPFRMVGGGARWLGALLALYVFQPAGLGAMFDGVGKRLLVDLASPWAIFAAAALLVIAAIAALAARWLAPLVFGSLPTAFAEHRKPRGSAA